MAWAADNIRKRLMAMPMAVALVPLIVGIGFSCCAEVPTALWGVAIGACIAAAALRRTRAGVWLCAAMFPLGAMLYALHTPPAIDYDTPHLLTLRAEGESVRGKERNTTYAEIVGYDGKRLTPAVRLVVRSDTTLRLAKGDCLSLRGQVRRFSDRSADYASLMYHRGYAGVLWLDEGQMFDFVPATPRGGLHEWAVEKLTAAAKPGDARATVVAMGAGERSQMSGELRRAYSRSGLSHLLAVSGLHVGIVFLLVNALLHLVPLLRHGNLWRCAVAVGAIWLYTALCGSAPSAVRAAVMFTVLQAGIAFSRERVGLNTLATAGVAMLVCSPNLLFDTGFRLSFVAVAGIIAWGVPLMRALRTRSRVCNALIDICIVGIVASLWTMPIVSHTFGIVPLAGIALNPAVVVSANIVVLAAVVALLLPASVAGVAVVPALWCAEVQNAMVGYAAQWAWCSVDYRLSAVAVGAIYALFVALTLLAWGFARKAEQQA